MPVINADIVDALQQMADILEIQRENAFRVRAYRNAARTIAELPESVTTMLARGEDLSELPHIGDDLAAKIRELAGTGHLAALDELAKRLPGDLAGMLRLPGLGPKRVALLHDQLHLKTLGDLRAAASAGKIRALRGFGARTEQRILEGLEHARRDEKRTPLAVAEQVAAPLLEYLKSADGVRECVIAGSLRRRRDTVGDLDILVAAAAGSRIIDRFVAYGDVQQVLAKGPTRSTVLLRRAMQVDLRVVPQACYGAALMYLTGSKAHNIALRTLAVGDNLKLNEYGLFRGSHRIAGRTEREVYEALGLPCIEPELREDRGEIEAARRRRLPRLVATGDIHGDLHCHTDATDGADTLEAMVAAARECGHEYLAITDHTQRLTMVHGLGPRELARQIAAIDRLNSRLRGFTILKSAEVDILEDGSLDLPDDILRELDLTVCAIHSRFNLSGSEQTGRVLRAMDNPHFHILAHPTGRLLGEREPYPIDIERLLRAALERGCFFEVNAQPQRLDLTDFHCRLAKEIGVKVAISTDAHRATDLGKMRFGVDQARRGWLEPSDILNTRSLKDLRGLLRKA